MKIRRINNYRNTVSGVERAMLSINNDTYRKRGWRMKGNNDFIDKFYSEKQWELVPPEPEWEDVTKQCGQGHTGPSRLYMPEGTDYAILADGYEFRKVEAYVIPDNGIRWLYSTPDKATVDHISQYRTTVLQVWRKQGE